MQSVVRLTMQNSDNAWPKVFWQSVFITSLWFVWLFFVISGRSKGLGLQTEWYRFSRISNGTLNGYFSKTSTRPWPV